MEAEVGIYFDPQERALVVSVDEKSEIKAAARRSTAGMSGHGPIASSTLRQFPRDVERR
jgi:hypothetical protein